MPRREYNREYYARNRERLLAAQKARDETRAEDKRAYNRQRYQRKRDDLVEGMKLYYTANKSTIKDARAEYYRRNREVYINRARAREGRFRHGVVWTSKAEQAEINGLYLFCEIFPCFEVDHIIPLNGKSASGLHVVGNLQVLSRTANRAKGNKFCPAYAELVQTLRSY